MIADQASGLYFSFSSLGVIVTPLAGSGVYALFNNDWAYTCDVFGVAAAIFTLCFLVFNVLPDIRKEKQENEQRIEAIKRSVMKQMESQKGMDGAMDHTLIVEENILID